MIRRITLAAATVACATSIVTSANATVFSAWQVSGVPYGDVLNIRKYPASYSQKQSAYPNGKILQMTGKCTGGVNLHDIAGLPSAIQRTKTRYQWCQVWHDPVGDGQFSTGWVYGRYIRPY